MPFALDDFDSNLCAHQYYIPNDRTSEGKRMELRHTFVSIVGEELELDAMLTDALDNETALYVAHQVTGRIN